MAAFQNQAFRRVRQVLTSGFFPSEGLPGLESRPRECSFDK